MISAERRTRVEGGEELGYLVWRFPEPLVVASTASSGGGIGYRNWIVNAQVAHSYARHDLDVHAAELAAEAGLAGPGVTMFTAADVHRLCLGVDGGVHAEATVGLTHPSWAAAADELDLPVRPTIGTINVVAHVPAALTEAALLGALCTATEAKTQALFDLAMRCTGTPSDAVTIACPAGATEPFCGVRSEWGSRLARAVHAAVSDGH
jgi:adenosylcobinamide hydrolase